MLAGRPDMVLVQIFIYKWPHYSDFFFCFFCRPIFTEITPTILSRCRIFILNFLSENAITGVLVCTVGFLNWAK